MRGRAVRLGSRELYVKEPPIFVLPYLQLYRKIVGTEPDCLEEAEKRSRELEEVVGKILEACVEGPLEGLSLSEQLSLLRTIAELLSEALRPEELEIFRGERGREHDRAASPTAA